MSGNRIKSGQDLNPDFPPWIGSAPVQAVAGKGVPGFVGAARSDKIAYLCKGAAPAPSGPARFEGQSRIPMNKPRVLFLVAEDWYFVSHRLSLARALAGAGLEVGVACRVTGAGAAIEGEGFRLFPLAMTRRSVNPFHLLACVFRIARAYRAFRPDVVHHVALKPALLGSIAARLTRIPAAVNAIAGLGYVFASASPRARALRPLVLGAMKRLLDGPARRTIVQNAADGAELARRGIVAEERLRLIRGSGVDLERFRPAPEPPGPPRATLVARMIAEKGVRELAEAARILAARGSDIRITLAGPVDRENPSAVPERDLRAWAEEGVLEYSGRVDDVPRLWRESHIAVLPSYYGEGVPLALIEAAASGRPMIACDGPGLGDVVIDGETGLLVPPRDPESLARAIERLAGDAELRRRMGAAARRHAEARFGAEAVNAKTLALYRELLGPRWPGT